MRHLSRKQKNSLRKYTKARWFDQNLTKPMFFDCTQDLTDKMYWAVFKLNEFESFDSHVDNFIDDIKTVKDCKII